MDESRADKFNLFFPFQPPAFSLLAREPPICYIYGMSETAAPNAPPKTDKKEKTDPKELRDRVTW